MRCRARKDIIVYTPFAFSVIRARPSDRSTQVTRPAVLRTPFLAVKSICSRTGSRCASPMRACDLIRRTGMGLTAPSADFYCPRTSGPIISVRKNSSARGSCYGHQAHLSEGTDRIDHRNGQYGRAAITVRAVARQRVSELRAAVDPDGVAGDPAG